MPLYNDLEVRSRMPSGLAQEAMRAIARPQPRASYGAAEQPLPPGTVRLEAPEEDLMPYLEEAFAQGTLGGASAGAAGRGAALVPYGLEAREAQRALGQARTPGQAAADALDWSRTGYASMPEEVKAARGEYLRRYDELFPGATEQYYGSGGGGFSHTEDLRARGILPANAYRGRGAPRFSESARHLMGDVVGEGANLGRRFGSAGLEENFDSSRQLRKSLWDQTVGDAELAFSLREAEEAAERIRGLASKRDLAKQMVTRGVKGALSPASIAADMVAGGAIGAGATGLGHILGGGSPESAGLFTAPGPGYEGVVSPELIERIAEQKELEREAERQRLLEQYRASGYDLDPNTRLSELR